jgi:hypothetical protein
MPLLDRKSQKLSYSLGTTGRLYILVCASLIVFTSLGYWLLRGATFESAKKELDDGYKWSIVCLSILAGGTGVSGIKIIDRSDERDP